jgi:hypothetical protein
MLPLAPVPETERGLRIDIVGPDLDDLGDALDRGERKAGLDAGADEGQPVRLGPRVVLDSDRGNRAGTEVGDVDPAHDRERIASRGILDEDRRDQIRQTVLFPVVGKASDPLEA